MNPKWPTNIDPIVSYDEKILDLFPHEFWYLSPIKTTFSVGDMNVRPLDFAILLHNAIIGNGFVVSMQVLLGDLPFSTEKRGVAAEAEELLERVRVEEYPNRPSRMRCHYLNFSKATAERRKHTMFRKPRFLTRCFVTGVGTIHAADVGIYERLEGRPTDVDLARSYWEPFLPKSNKDGERLELLADTTLYFPDWWTFPILNDNALMAWQLQISMVDFIKKDENESLGPE